MPTIAPDNDVMALPAHIIHTILTNSKTQHRFVAQPHLKVGDVIWPNTMHEATVTRIWQQAVDEINHDDALAEGVTGVSFYPDHGFPLSIGYMMGADDEKHVLETDARKACIAHLKKLGAADTVWCIEFKRFWSVGPVQKT